MKKDYCTQNDGDCSTCSLVNYGYDCMNHKVSDDTGTPDNNLRIGDIIAPKVKPDRF